MVLVNQFLGKWFIWLQFCKLMEVLVAGLRNENLHIRTNVETTTKHYLNVEAENSVLRCQVNDLSCKLLSLEEIISVTNASNGVGILRSIVTEPVMHNFL